MAIKHTASMAVLALGACVTAAPGSCPPPPGMDAWSAAWAEKDASAFNLIYSEDGVFQPPSGEPTRGGEAIGQRLQRGFDAMLVEFEREEVEGGCRVAYERGRFVDLTRGDRELIEDGRYLVVWRAEEGVWRIAHHAYAPSTQ